MDIRIALRFLSTSLLVCTMVVPSYAQHCTKLLGENAEYLEKSRTESELSVNGGPFQRCLPISDGNMCGSTHVIHLNYITDKSGNPYSINNKKLKTVPTSCKLAPEYGANVYENKDSYELEGVAGGAIVKYRSYSVLYYRKTVPNF